LLLRSCHFEILAHGNLDASEATSIANMVRVFFLVILLFVYGAHDSCFIRLHLKMVDVLGSKPLELNLHPEQRIIYLPPGIVALSGRLQFLNPHLFLSMIQ
jgi:hypothetical protein